MNIQIIEETYLKDFDFSKLETNISELMNQFSQSDIISFFIQKINKSENIQPRYLFGLFSLPLDVLNKNAKIIVESISTEFISYIFENTDFSIDSKIAKEYIVKHLNNMKVKLTSNDEEFDEESSDLEMFFLSNENMIAHQYKNMQPVLLDILELILSEEALKDNPTVISYALYRLSDYLNNRFQNIMYNFIVNCSGKDNFKTLQEVLNYEPFIGETIYRIAKYINSIDSLDLKKHIPIIVALKNQIYDNDLDIKHISFLFEKIENKYDFSKYEYWKIFLETIPNNHSNYEEVKNIFIESLWGNFKRLLKENYSTLRCNPGTLHYFANMVKNSSNLSLRQDVIYHLEVYADILELRQKEVRERKINTHVFTLISQVLGTLIDIEILKEDRPLFFYNFAKKSMNYITLESMLPQIKSLPNSPEIVEVIVTKFLSNNKDDNKFKIKPFISFLKNQVLLNELSYHSDREIRFIAQKRILTFLPKFNNQEY